LRNAFDFSQTPGTPTAPNTAVGEDAPATVLASPKPSENVLISRYVLWGAAAGVLVLVIGGVWLLLRRRQA
jgi:hypothetical protein